MNVTAAHAVGDLLPGGAAIQTTLHTLGVEDAAGSANAGYNTMFGSAGLTATMLSYQHWVAQ